MALSRLTSLGLPRLTSRASSPSYFLLVCRLLFTVFEGHGFVMICGGGGYGCIYIYIFSDFLITCCSFSYILNVGLCCFLDSLVFFFFFLALRKHCCKDFLNFDTFRSQGNNPSSYRLRRAVEINPQLCKSIHNIRFRNFEVGEAQTESSWRQVGEGGASEEENRTPSERWRYWSRAGLWSQPLRLTQSRAHKNKPLF